MAGAAAGGFISRAFESMLKECSGKKYPALYKSIQTYLGIILVFYISTSVKGLLLFWYEPIDGELLAVNSTLLVVPPSMLQSLFTKFRSFSVLETILENGRLRTSADLGHH